MRLVPLTPWTFRFGRVCRRGAVVVASAAAATTCFAGELALRATSPAVRDLSEWRLADARAGGGLDLFAVTRAGTLETFSLAVGAGELARAEAGHLEDPAHACLAFARLEPDAPLALLCASPRGVERRLAAADGGYSGAPLVLAPRARCRVRTGRPVFAPLAQDVNGDGRADLVVPNASVLEVWIQSPTTGETRGASFAKAAAVQVRVSSAEALDASDLSDDLESSLLIPALQMADVNGDGRPDLLVEDGEKRAFHLVRADGSIPATPDVSVDLGIFRDTTPRGELSPGRTLAGGEKAVYVSRDLDGDGVPDAVIAQGRKVWVFHGSARGPQFTEPSTVLKAADDVTAAYVLNLDGDGRPDLLLLKLQVPSLATILRGLVASWEVELEAIGYRNGGERKFETTPAWRSTIRFQVPAILTIVKDPESILERFEEVGRKFRAPIETDVDGDGARDVALLTEDAEALELWRGDASTAAAEQDTTDDVLRRVLFEDEDKSWDLDRLAAWLTSFGERRVALVTGGREPAARFALRDPAEWRLASVEAGELDGDGRGEIVLCYEKRADPAETRFDVVGWK